MGFGSAIASAFEAARVSTESIGVQSDVTVRAFIQQDAMGARLHGGPVVLRGMAQEGLRKMTSESGVTLTVKAIVTFFPQAAGEDPPDVGMHDIITLKSGLTGPVIERPRSILNPDGKPYARTVWLG